MSNILSKNLTITATYFPNFSN